MSPHVNNFVTDLVLMAKAMEELPQVREELTATQACLDERSMQLEKRELHIIELKREIDTHLAIIRSLEVARDDAELRFLELEENSNMAIGFARTAETNLAAVMSLLSPSKPEPVSATQPMVESQNMGHGSSEPIPSDQGPSVDPLPETNWADGSAQSLIATGPNAPAQTVDPSPGQSEPDPTASNPVDVTLQDAANLPKQDVSGISSSGKYSGRFYADWFYHVPLDKWIEGGGTEYSYNFRRPAAGF